MPKTRSQSSSTYLKRRRWTAEDAKQALTALKQSGLSPSAFATRWRRQLGTTTATAFEEIVRHDAAPGLDGEVLPPPERERFEIVLTSGRVVRVPASFDGTALRQLLIIVDEARPC